MPLTWKNGAATSGLLLICIAVVPALPASKAAVDSLERSMSALDGLLEEEAQPVGSLLAARSYGLGKGEFELQVTTPEMERRRGGISNCQREIPPLLP